MLWATRAAITHSIFSQFPHRWRVISDRANARYGWVSWTEIPIPAVSGCSLHMFAAGWAPWPAHKILNERQSCTYLAPEVCGNLPALTATREDSLFEQAPGCWDPPWKPRYKATHPWKDLVSYKLQLITAPVAEDRLHLNPISIAATWLLQKKAAYCSPLRERSWLLPQAQLPTS